MLERVRAAGLRLALIGILASTLFLIPQTSAYGALPNVVGTGKIAFERHPGDAEVKGDIYTIYPDGSGLTNLMSSSDPGNDYQDFLPAWSPDGTRIAFASDRPEPGDDDDEEQELDIWVMDADGANQQLLTDDHTNGVPQFDRFPTWSPDGDQIAWMRTIPDENYEIFAMNVTSSCLQTGPCVTVHDTGSCDECDGIPVRITDFVGEDSSPDWNPDTSGGDEIVYHRKNHDGTGPDEWPCPPPTGNVNCWDLYKVDVPSGTTPNTPTQLTNTNDAYDGTGTWSPDGSEIVFRRSHKDVGNEIYTMPASGDMSGTAASRTTYAWYHDQTPDWSPDGTRFAWGSSRLIDGDPTCGGSTNVCDPEFDIWVSYADGSGQERITSGSDNDREPDWQPRTCTLTGTSGNDTGSSELVGTSGDDVICGLGGNDTLKGMGGNDILVGGAGDDVYNGGDGNDWFDEEAAPNGADAFYGGNGTDTVSYVNRTNRVSITLNGTADDGDPDANGGAGEDDATFGAVEIQLGGSGNDTLGGSSNAERFYGFDGDDTLQGWGAADILDGGAGNDALHGESAPTSGSDPCIATGTSAGADNLYGFNGNDLLCGNGANDQLWGGAGDDDIYGMDGDDTMNGESLKEGADDYYGGSGTDTANYAHSSLDRGRQAAGTRLHVSLNGLADDGVYNFTNNTTLEGDNIGPNSDVENVTGGNSNDKLVGNLGLPSAANILTGGPAEIRPGVAYLPTDLADELVANDGTGNDTVDGGPAADTCTAVDTGDTVANC